MTSRLSRIANEVRELEKSGLCQNVSWDSDHEELDVDIDTRTVCIIPHPSHPFSPPKAWIKGLDIDTDIYAPEDSFVQCITESNSKWNLIRFRCPSWSPSMTFRHIILNIIVFLNQFDNGEILVKEKIKEHKEHKEHDKFMHESDPG